MGLPNIGKNYIKDINQERIRYQAAGIADDVDVELDKDICTRIQEIVDEIYEKN